MISLRQSIFLTLLLTSSACTKPSTYKAEYVEVVSVKDLPVNFKMPSKVWELIESNSDGKADEKKEEASAEKSEKNSSPPILYSSVQVFLTEKNPGVLKAPAYRIDLPRGGGRLDLSDYVSEQAGSFFVGFELPEEFTVGTNFKAFYISQARRRKMDDRIFGAGCSQFLEITPKFLEMMKAEGIRANTTRERHVTLLAGHYVFSVLKEGRIYITQATITDSKNKNLLCEAM